MNVLKRKFFIVAAGFIAAFGALTFAPALSSPVLADSKGEAQAGVNATGGTGGLTINGLIANIVNILSWIVGVVSVIMIIIGGLSYVTAQGDSGKLASAKNTIIYALVGLVIVLFAQVLVQFIITESTGGGGKKAEAVEAGTHIFAAPHVAYRTPMSVE